MNYQELVRELARWIDRRPIAEVIAEAIVEAIADSIEADERPYFNLAKAKDVYYDFLAHELHDGLKRSVDKGFGE